MNAMNNSLYKTSYNNVYKKTFCHKNEKAKIIYVNNNNSVNKLADFTLGFIKGSCGVIIISGTVFCLFIMKDSFDHKYKLNRYEKKY